MANTFACLCSCQWWTFWTYLMTVNLFSLYLMNFIFHTTLDAVGNILRVHYKSMKCDVSFSQGSVSTLFRWDEHIFHVCVKMFFLLTAVQKYKNQTIFSRVMITNVLPRFFYETQCILWSQCVPVFCPRCRPSWVIWLFMAALCNRPGHIYFHPVVCSFFLLFSFLT